MAYRQAGIKDPGKEIHVAEVHDCFTITELVNYEDLGFCGRGKGKAHCRWSYGSERGTPGQYQRGTEILRPSSGATGVRMVADVVNQMRGRSGKRQVKKADMGLTHTLADPDQFPVFLFLEDRKLSISMVSKKVHLRHCASTSSLRP